MIIHRGVALFACIFLPLAGFAEDKTATNNAESEEIVVVGRSIATSSTRIEVEREILVDTAAALRDIPGANVNSNGLITGIAQYRGMFGDRVAVDIDQLGVTSGGPNAMDTPLSYMSPMMTEELVVSRGVAGVSLAPEAIGGHISARTSRGEFGGDAFGLSGMLGTRFSDNGDITTTAARLTLANQNHRISAIAEFDSGDDIDTPEGKIRPSQLSRDRYDMSYAFDDAEHHFLVFAGRLDTGKTGTPALPMDILLIDTELYGAQLGFDISSLLTIDGRFSYNNVVHEMDNFSLREGAAPAMQRINTAQGSGSRFHLAGSLAKGVSGWILGIDGTAADHESIISNPNNPMFQVDNFIDVTRDLLGVFTEWTRRLDSSEIEVGLRYNRVRTNAGETSATGMMGMMATNVDTLAANFNSSKRDLSWSTFDGVVKYRYEIAGSTEWTFEVGRKSRAPSYQEIYLWLPLQSTGGLADGRTYIGNLGLKEERSTEVVVGVSTHLGRLAMSPQVYYRRVADYIQGVPSTNMLANMVAIMMSGRAPLQFENVGAEIFGFDAAWRYELSKNFLLDGVVSIARGRRTDAGDDLYRLSPFNASLGLTYSTDAWSMKSEIAGYARQDKVSSYNEEPETPGYWLLNLGLTWNPQASLRVEARIDNLLNEAYQDHVTGINRAASMDIPVGTRLFGAERTLSAGLIYSF